MAYRIILKIPLYLWNNVPVFGGHWIRICFLSNAPNTHCMFHMVSKPSQLLSNLQQKMVGEDNQGREIHK